MRLRILTVALGVPLLAQAQMHPAEKPALLEPELVAQLVERNARIGRIEMVVENVFDTTKPEEDKRLHKFANKVHVTTHDGVLESLLLFETGDLYDPEVLLESERLIRSRGWIADATIVPSAYDPEANTVDILVTTRDSWSLSTNISLGRSGGANHYGIGFEEKNLLGTGKSVQFLHESNVDRDRDLLGFIDENIRGSRVRIDTSYASASDGSSKSLLLGRPFYSLTTRWSFDTVLLD